MILALNLLIMQVATWVLVPSATFLNLLWVAATNIALFRGHFLINAARLLGVGFNAEVTTSPGIAPPPCSHGWPTVLVLFFFGCPERLSLKACCPSFLWSRLAEDRIVLGDISWLFGLSLFIFGYFFLLGMGLGLFMKWAEAAEFFEPTIAPQNSAIRLLGRRGGF